MKKIIIGLSLLLTTASVYSQRKENDPKHENHYKQVSTIENDNVKIDISDAHSQINFCKMKLKITNKTSDYILFKPSQTIFKLEQGDFKLTDKDIIIPPFETDSKTLIVKGESGFHVKNFTLLLNGFYKIPANGTVINASDFKLPASVNDFTAGPFQCTLSKSTKTTDETEAQFKCTYTGNAYGIIRPSKISIKTEKGEEFATTKSTEKSVILTQGKKDTFSAKFKIPAKVVDMQFANLSIVWKDTFSESNASSIQVPSEIKFELDPALTDAKNK